MSTAPNSGFLAEFDPKPGVVERLRAFFRSLHAMESGSTGMGNSYERKEKMLHQLFKHKTLVAVLGLDILMTSKVLLGDEKYDRCSFFAIDFCAISHFHHVILMWRKAFQSAMLNLSWDQRSNIFGLKSCKGLAVG